MNEQTERYLKMARRNLDKIVLAILYLMLAALVFLWYQEQNSAETVATETKFLQLKDPVASNPYWAGISSMSAPQKMENYPAIEQIRKYNMFDIKNVRPREEIERRANQKFKQAEEAAAKNQKDEALRLLKEILAEFPNHRRARDLNATLTGATTGTAVQGSVNNSAGTAPGATPTS